MTEAELFRRGAHRASRRADIIDAAVRVFSRTGLADASIQDVAAEARVGPTAIYYHFTGKEDLFDHALEQVLLQIADVVETARPATESGDAAGLERVIDAVWDWIETSPYSARFFQLHLAGASGRARQLREDFEQRHTERAFDYLPGLVDGDVRAERVRRATQGLAVRTLITATTLVASMRVEGGPLSDLPAEELRQATRDLGRRLIQ